MIILINKEEGKVSKIISKLLKSILKNSKGNAVVEATILFPIMIMIFAALVMLSAYLPTRAALQRATQYAATTLITEYSDVWLFYDLYDMSFYWEKDKERLGTVYSSVLSSFDDVSIRAEKIVKDTDKRLASLKEGELIVECNVNNRLIFKEIEVTASRKYKPPVNLSFIGFPEVIEITITSIATINDGDEFIRNFDLLTSFSDFISERFGISNVRGAIESYGSHFKALIGK